MNDLVLLIVSHPLVRWVLGLLLANVLLGIAASLHAREFRLGAVADWLATRALPYLLGALAVQVVVYVAVGDYRELAEALATATWAFVLAALLGKIAATLREFGVPLPAGFTDRPGPGPT